MRPSSSHLTTASSSLARSTVPNSPVGFPKLPKPSTRSPGISSWSLAAGSASGGLLARSESAVAPGRDRGGWGALRSLGIGLLIIASYLQFLSRLAEQRPSLRLFISSMDKHRLGKNGSAGRNCTVWTMSLAQCGSSGLLLGACNPHSGSSESSPPLSPSSDSGIVRSGKDSRQGPFSVVVPRAPFECQIPRRRLFIPHPRFLAPNNVYSRHTLISAEEIRKCQTKSGSKHLKTAEK